MLITYKCKKCGSKRFFSTVKEGEIECKKCGSKMDLVKGNESFDLLTTPEARFMADEAMYGTLGDHMPTAKHRVKHC